MFVITGANNWQREHLAGRWAVGGFATSSCLGVKLFWITEHSDRKGISKVSEIATAESSFLTILKDGHLVSAQEFLMICE